MYSLINTETYCLTMTEKGPEPACSHRAEPAKLSGSQSQGEQAGSMTTDYSAVVA